MAKVIAMQKSLSSSSALQAMQKSLSNHSLERSKSVSGYPAGYEDYAYDSDGGRSLGNFGADEEEYVPRRQVKRNLSCEMKQAVQNLEYSPQDLEGLARDNAQFESLKQSLRKKGAVTNEILKQKLPLFLKYKKDRIEARNKAMGREAPARMPRRSRSASSASGALSQMRDVSEIERRSSSKPANRVLTEEELDPSPGEQAPTAHGVFGRILRLPSSDHIRNTPLRANSTMRSVPDRTASLSMFARRVPSETTPKENFAPSLPIRQRTNSFSRLGTRAQPETLDEEQI